MVKANTMKNARTLAREQRKEINKLRNELEYERNISKFRVSFGYDLKGEIEDECENREEKRKIREKYKKMINSLVKVKGWEYKDIRTSNIDTFKKCYEEEVGYPPSYRRVCEARTTLVQYKIYRQKKFLKHVKKSFKNDDFIAYTNQYVQHKISEKDKEIQKLKQELKDSKFNARMVRRQVRYMGRVCYQLKTYKTGDLIEEFNELKSMVNEE